MGRNFPETRYITRPTGSIGTSPELKVSLIMFFLNMVYYPVFFPSLSTLTWDTFLTLRGTQGFYLNHVLPPGASKSYGVVGGVGWYEILVTAQVLGFGIWIGLWTWACQ